MALKCAGALPAFTRKLKPKNKHRHSVQNSRSVLTSVLRYFGSGQSLSLPIDMLDEMGGWFLVRLVRLSQVGEQVAMWAN